MSAPQPLRAQLGAWGFGPRIALQALEDRSVPATLLSTDAAQQTPLPGDASVLQASTDGRYVIFQSTGLDVVPGQRNVFPGAFNLFWQDNQTGDRRLVSSDRFSQGKTASGFEPTLPGQALTGVISGDGLSVAYVSKRNAAFVNNYAYDSADGLTTALASSGGVVSTQDSGDDSEDIFYWNSTSSKAAAVNSKDANALLSTEWIGPSDIDRITAVIAIGNTSSASNPAISRSGGVVSFVTSRDAAVVDPFFPESGDEFIIADNGDNTPDLFRVDVGEQTNDALGNIVGTNTFPNIVSVYFNPVFNINPTAFGLTSGFLQVDPLARYMSAAGDGFTFLSNLSPSKLDLTFPASTPGTVDVYHVRYESQYDLSPDPGAGDNNAVPNLITSAPGRNGITVNQRAVAAIIPPDAPDTVVFSSAPLANSTALVPGFVNQNGNGTDVFLRSVGEFFSVNAAELVSAASTSALLGANQSAAPDFFSLSTDRLGNQIAFASAATNLAPGFSYTAGAANIFVRDTVRNRTRLASVSINGQAGSNGTSANPRINTDGTIVAFDSNATNLALIRDSNGGADVFVRDLVANATGVASATPDNAATGNGASSGPVIGGVATNGALYFNTRATDLDPLYTVPVGTQQVATVSTPFRTQSTSRGVAISGGTSGLAGIFSIGSDGELDAQQAPVSPFPGYLGQISVSSGDVTGDGVSDLAAGGGPGGGPRVRVINGLTQATVYDFFAYESTFRGGVNVALADVNGDGRDDIIVGSGTGGGPRIVVFSGLNGQKIADFFAYEAGFRGGVRVAAGDINGDGRADIVAAAGEGGGPRIVVFSGADLSGGTRLADFFAFEPGLRNGVYVGVGDVNGDGLADVAVGGGPGGGPRVSVFDSGTIVAPPLAGSLPTLYNFFAFPDSPSNRTGVRVAIRNVAGSTFDQIVAAAGSGSPLVRVFDPALIGGDANPTPITETFAFDQSVGTFGAYVG